METPYTLSLCSNFDTRRPLSEIDWSQVILDTSRKYWITSDCFHSWWHFKSFQYISSICKCNKYSSVCKPFPLSSDWGQEDSSAERQLRRTPQEYVEKMCGALWDAPWVNMHDVLCSCLGTKIIILKQIWVVKACLWERWASFASKIRKSSRPPTARTARSRSLKQHLSNYTCKGMTLLSWNLCPTLDGETFGWQTDLRQVEACASSHKNKFRFPHPNSKI